MQFHRRHLPHLYNTGQAVFITWRLHDSLPPNRTFPDSTSGKAFALMDRLLDETDTGPRYLARPELAQIVVDAIFYGAEVLEHYHLHAYVVMSNHVHLLVTPLVPLPRLTRSLKGITAKRANELLRQTGRPFWAEESYDHLVRNEDEARRIKLYIENNPVRAELVRAPADFRWSSGAAGGPPADQGVRRTLDP